MNTEAPSSLVSVLVRIVWMMVGPVILLLLALSIAVNGGGWLAPKGVAYLVVLAAILGSRWVEFRMGHPQTAMGTPARPQDLPRYVLLATIAGLAVWSLASLIGARTAGPSSGTAERACPLRSIHPTS